MATVEKRGKSWRLVAYLGYDETGKQIRVYKNIPTKDTSKAEAKREAAKFEASLQQKKLRTDDLRNATLSQFIEYWKEHYGNTLSETTIATHANYLPRIEELLGHIRIRKLTPAHILKFIQAISQPGIRKDRKDGTLSSRTIQIHFEILTAILNKAVKWQFIEDNPCRFVDRPSATSKPTPILQPAPMKEFIRLLLTTAPYIHRLFFLFAFTDGLRRSEVMGIDEKALDLENGYLDITTVGVLDKNHKVVYKEKTKTSKSHARMKISPVTLKITKEYLSERRLQEEALGIHEDQHCSKLFTHLDGTPYNPNSFLKWLQAFARRHGFKHITIQSLRKMAVTYVIPEINLKEAAEFARHSNIGTTAKAYSEVLADRREIPTTILDGMVQEAIYGKVKH